MILEAGGVFRVKEVCSAIQNSAPMHAEQLPFGFQGVQIVADRSLRNCQRCRQLRYVQIGLLAQQVQKSFSAVIDCQCIYLLWIFVDCCCFSNNII